MNGMQATIEASVQFHNFYNVDLFQRGFYQIRSHIKSSPKLPIKVEVILPRNQPSDLVFPACVINKTAVSRTVQILYRNEEVLLNDVVHFRIHAIVENGKIEETLEKADLQLILELWYTENGSDLVQESPSTSNKFDDDSEDSGAKSRRGSLSGSVSQNPETTIECVSSRILKLNFCPSRGLHYHLPILFDYFHLAAVSTTIHMVLSSLHQPYINLSKNGSISSSSGSSSLNKSRKSSAKNVQNAARLSQPTMETIFFGAPQNKPANRSSSCLESGARLSTARRIHYEVCSILLASLESLQLTLMQFSNLLSEPKARAQAKISVTDCRKRLNNLSDMAKDCQLGLRTRVTPICSKERNSKSAPKSNKEIAERWERSRLYLAIDTEDEFLAVANSDISQLCGELVLLWNNFVNVCVGRHAIRNHLSRIHHLNRVKRFSEGFFIVQHPRTAALSCCESTYSKYENVSEQLRSSKYLSTLPSLPVSCTSLDGDASNLPIIFEDKYQDDLMPDGSAANTRSSATNVTNAPNFLGPEWERLGADNRRHSFCDLPTLDDNSLDTSQDEGLLTLKEMLLYSKLDNNGSLAGRRPPRPSSIPAAKKFGGDSILRADLDYARLQKRLARSVRQVSNTDQTSDAKTTSDQQDQQIVPNHLDQEDEPNVLTATPCLPTPKSPEKKDEEIAESSSRPVSTHLLKGLTNGFSHLEWSSAVPYNLAEEPDDVQGMKHSHSCHSMPSNEQERKLGNTLLSGATESVPNLSGKINQGTETSETELESGCGTLDNIEENTNNSEVKESDQKLVGFVVTSRQGRKTSQTSETTLSSSDDGQSSSSSCEDESDAVKSFQDEAKVKRRAWDGSRDSGKHSFSSSPSDPTNGFINGESDAQANQKTPNKSYITPATNPQTEIPNGPMISATVTRETQEELTRKLEEFRLKSRSTKASFVNRPRAKSEEAMIKFSGDAIFQPRCRLQSESGSPRKLQPSQQKLSDTLSSPLLIQSLSGQSTTPNPKPKSDKISLPPPVQFRDPPRGADTKVNGHSTLGSSDANRIRREKLERKTSSSRILKADEPAVYESPVSRSATFGNGVRDLSKAKSKVEFITEDSGTIPLRKKSKAKDQLIDSASLSRLESKRSHQNPAVYISPSQKGETAAILRPKTKSNLPSKESTTTNEDVSGLQTLVPVVSEETVNFIKAKEDFKKTINFNGTLYSDLSRFPSTVPYFHPIDDTRTPVRRNFHLVVCVHGLEGNSADLRLIKTYLEMAMPGQNLDFLMSEGNQGDTFSSFESMTDRLVGEILLHISSYTFVPARISFVGHSLGCILIRSAISRPEMSHLVSRFYTYLSLSGPHLGTLYNNSGLVNMGMWFMQKWKKSGSLHQLALKDATDIRKTFMYQLSVRSNLHMFKHVLLAGSTQDRYVPWHSARIEMCKTAVKDRSVTGSAYREMVENIISPIISRPEVTLCRYDIHHALPSNTTNTIIGRAAHIAVLDSELFIEKFLIISVIKYFQ